MADETPAAPQSSDCQACRGIGQVTSNLGGEPRLVACPWCEGSGVRLVGHDAQTHWREAAASAADAAPAGTQAA